MAGDLENDDRGYEQHQQQVSESVDGGGCAETWEALSEQRTQGKDSPEQQQLDVEGILLDIDCLQFTGDGEDFTLDPTFRRSWRSAVEDLDDERLETVIADVFGMDGAIQIDETEQAVHLRHDGRLLAQWVSHPAMVADLTACQVFEQRDDDWADRSAAERSRFAGSVRLYLDFCPDCDGDASFDTEAVTSCCNDYEVATVSCEDCGVRLFEMPVATE